MAVPKNEHLFIVKSIAKNVPNGDKGGVILPSGDIIPPRFSDHLRNLA